jgi:RNA polymerase sigma factor (sigma-70 family)
LPGGQEIKHIIQGCVETNRASQKEFYKTFYGFAMGICMRYCNTKDEAMEVVNDGFLKIYKELSRFNPIRENYEISLKGWMKKIMVNTAIDHFRKNSKNHLVNEINDAHLEVTDLQETPINKLSYKEIMEIIQRLSPVYRAVFNLHVIDGFTHEEIASQLNMAVGTSKSNLAKAKINIQNMLKEADKKFYEQKTG